MNTPVPSGMLRIHLCEGDRPRNGSRDAGKPLYAAIVDLCRELNIAGATVLRGVEGFGGSAMLHTGHLVHRDQPLEICIVDSDENLQRLMEAVSPMLGSAFMAVSRVEVIRVQQPASV